jgi:hypothetical protein
MSGFWNVVANSIAAPNVARPVPESLPVLSNTATPSPRPTRSCLPSPFTSAAIVSRPSFVLETFTSPAKVIAPPAAEVL